MKPARLLIVGAGSRGTTYAANARQHPHQAVVVGAAEPRDFYRDRLAEEHRIPRTHVFRDWQEAAGRPALADAMVIATRVTARANLGGHGGGDWALMHSFLAAVAHGDPGLVLSGSVETLETHLIVFAAERARREGRVVSMDEG